MERQAEHIVEDFRLSQKFTANVDSVSG